MQNPKYPSKEWVVGRMREKGREVTPQEVEEMVRDMGQAVVEAFGLRVPNAELDYDTRVRLFREIMELATNEEDMIKNWTRIAEANGFSGFHLVRHPVEREWEPRYFKGKLNKAIQALRACKQGYDIIQTYYVKE